MRKNPFEVLGITPEMARSLNEEDLFKLVKSNYRLLQRVYHPDVQRPHLRPSRRLKERAIQINLSYEKLDMERNPESFSEQRRLYIGRLKGGMRKMVRDLEEQVRHQGRHSEAVRTSFMEYILANLDHKLTVLKLRSCRLGLNDVALGYNYRSSSWNIGRNYKEMEFDDEGNLFLRPPGRGQFAFTSTIRLVGTVEEEHINPVELLDKRPLPRESALNGNSSRPPRLEDGPFELRNSLSCAAFKQHCLPHLKADVAERRFLFSIHISPSIPQQAQFYLEGMIVKIDRRQ